jgi:hypothetical protein
MREKLIELIEETEDKYIKCIRNSVEPRIDFGEFFADRLIENGIIAPPCKVGDTVYIISDYTNEILSRLIIGIIIKKDGYGFIFDTQSSWSDTDIGKTVFLTREEAEKALAERSGE